MMMFFIDKNIVFLPERQMLRNTDTGAETGLNLVATQLLVFLLQHAETVCGRNELLDAVFVRNNSSASDGNLNRHIMILRRAFTDLHCQADVIITVPRNGFKIGNVKIRQVDPEPDPFSPSVNTEETEFLPEQENISNAPLPARKKTAFGYTLLAVVAVCFFLGAAGYYFLTPGPRIYRPAVSIFKTEQYQHCEITYTSGTRYAPPASVITELNHQGENVSCRDPLKITLWRNDTPTQTWHFTTLCDSLNKCRGIYVYTQK
ncbi:winged helix-turn-helix domain-containing protein [Enterobacter chuandaensis]|uniref:winged helix-turn-helix domain-containing protein n=1 Tax=Enterobacter chuandaensis TaxID=2497875 RepID=UPI0020758399|nr:winged helix-turn-helix domain-containing protein [Enterobacter chuandaensis]MCM7588023.1 winged helix-turn-helix domain-containing protein [Enterobacter chuandaensis]